MIVPFSYLVSSLKNIALKLELILFTFYLVYKYSKLKDISLLKSVSHGEAVLKR